MYLIKQESWLPPNRSGLSPSFYQKQLWELAKEQNEECLVAASHLGDTENQEGETGLLGPTMRLMTKIP